MVEFRWSAAAMDAWMREYPLVHHHPLLKDCWNYESGCILRAASLLYERTGQQQYLQYVQHNIDAYVDGDGAIRTYVLEDYNLDQINQGRCLLFLHKYLGHSKYLQAAERLFAQLQEQPRTEEGSYWHKKIYPNQVWLDGLYMALPFLVEYGQLHQQPDLIDLACSQLLLAERLLRNPETGLLQHGYDESREQPWASKEHGRSPHAWLRSIGWYSMALVDVLDGVPATHSVRDCLISHLDRLMSVMLREQDESSGIWHQVLGQGKRDGNYLESSGSAMVIYAAQKARNKGWLSHSYQPFIDKAYTGLLAHAVEKDEEGRVWVHHINRVAGLGGTPYRDGSYAYYIGEPVVSNDPKGYAPFIFAAMERELLLEACISE